MCFLCVGDGSCGNVTKAMKDIKYLKKNDNECIFYPTLLSKIWG